MPSVHAELFRKRQFADETIIVSVRWYLRFSLSLRDVECLMAERGVNVDYHSATGAQSYAFGGTTAPRDSTGEEETQRKRPKIDAVRGLIDGILEADRQAPRKQRHTAHRIWTRLQTEQPEPPIAEATVRLYAQRWKQASGEGREAFVPQSYELGQEAQVDWFEAVVKLNGEARNLHIFAMRSMSSGDAFHCAYTHATQQALLEAHELACAYFGGSGAKHGDVMRTVFRFDFVRGGFGGVAGDLRACSQGRSCGSDRDVEVRLGKAPHKRPESPSQLAFPDF